VNAEVKVITLREGVVHKAKRMDPTNMVLFRKEDVSRVLSALDVPVRGQRILDPSGVPAICHTCGSDIKKSNLGNIMPGSRLFFCDNPACLATYIAETKT
jgi:hypothetical protein